jgi:tRNA A37 methylthiotransferase MiaB
MDGEVSSEVKERRSARLMKLASESADEFARTLIGGVSPVLIESRRRDSSIGSGLTDNYVRVLVHGGNAPVGELVNVRVESVSQGTTSGSVVE